VKYDSILGTFDADVKVVDDTHISIDGKSIEIVSNRDPLKLPWKELGVQIVIEGTGVFIDTPGASKHLEAGAEKVIITAPCQGRRHPHLRDGCQRGPVHARRQDHLQRVVHHQRSRALRQGAR
jgi:glyceraldehyde-3-phosphate dehydrogenase (NADP+) (phosphorylating)